MEGSEPKSVLHWNLVSLDWRRDDRSLEGLAMEVPGLITESVALLLPSELEPQLLSITRGSDVSIVVSAQPARMKQSGIDQWGIADVWSDHLLDAFHPKQLKDTINEVFERVARDADERDAREMARAVEFRRVLVEG